MWNLQVSLTNCRVEYHWSSLGYFPVSFIADAIPVGKPTAWSSWGAIRMTTCAPLPVQCSEEGGEGQSEVVGWKLLENLLTGLDRSVLSFPTLAPQWPWAWEHVQALSRPDVDVSTEMKSPTGTFVFSGYISFSSLFFSSISLSPSSSFYTKSGSRDDPIPHTLYLFPLKYYGLIYILTSIYIFMFHSLKIESANFPCKWAIKILSFLND